MTGRGRRFWVRETLAGLSGAIGSVPDGMATAVLAGANPMAGLYASFAAPIVGGVLTSTSVMVIATTSAAAVTTSDIMRADLADPLRTLATLTILAGLLMLAFTALGFARLLRFVSASVMAGFMFGIGLILILGQLGDAVGVHASGPNTAAKAWSTLQQVESFDVPSLLTAIGAIAITAVLTRGRMVGLAPLVGLVVPMAVLAATGAQVATVASAGELTTGMPSLVLPDISLIDANLISTAVALAVIVLVQAAGVAATYPEPGPAAGIRADLRAQGVANLASGIVGGIPVGGSVGQTAVNVLAGGKTRWAVVISGVWMLVFVVALGPLLSAVPIPALAGLLMLAGFQALRPKRLGRSMRMGRPSAVAAVVTMVATLVAPIQVAVLTGIVLSLMLVGVSSSSRVRVSGLEPDAHGWKRVARPRTVPSGRVTVVDVEGAHAFSAVDRLFQLLPDPPETPERPGVLVIRMRAYLVANLTFALALERYANDLHRAGIDLVVCGLGPRAHAQLTSAHLPSSTVLIEEGEHVGESLAAAHAHAMRMLDGR